MEIKITSLIDNSVETSSNLWGEHGLSFWIETAAGPVLFDTGQSGAVLEHNAKALDYDLARVTAVAISHAHYDHTGGLPALLEHTGAGLPLYANPDLFRERYARAGQGARAIGMPLTEAALTAQVALHLDAAPQEIAPGLWTTGVIASRPDPMGRGKHHLVRDGAGWAPDPYEDDMSLVAVYPAGLVLLCGCCHAGLLNTLATVQRHWDAPIIAIAGGTHLSGADAAHLDRLVGVLRDLPALQRVYLSHCSGDNALYALWRAFGPDMVRRCPAGTTLDLEVLR